MSRFSFGDNPLSQALRACTISASAPAAITARAMLVERDFRVLIVDTDPALDGDGDAHRALHGSDAIGDQCRFGHQARTEAAVLYPIRRASDIEIDLVVAEILADLRGCREIARIGPAELQRDRMFALVEAKQPHAIAVNDRARGQHLRIKQRTPRQQTMEDAAMPVRPVHHRRNAETAI